MSDLILPEFLETETTYDEMLENCKVVGSIKSSFSEVSTTLLHGAYALLEDEKKVRVHALVMDAVTYSETRKWSSDVIDRETKRENLVKGVMAWLWGAMVVVSRKIPSRTILALSEEEHKTACLLQLATKEESGSDDLVQLHRKIVNGLGSVISTSVALQKDMNILVKKLNIKK